MNRIPSGAFLACQAVLAAFFPAWAAAEDLSPSARQMLHDVKVLAADEFEGRGVGTEGLKKAGEYIAEQFRAAGLNVSAAGGDPFQDFDINDGARLGSPNTLILHGPDGKSLELKYDHDFRTCAFGGSGKFDAPLVFAGYGITADDIGYDDFDQVDVKGKVVIVMRRNPQQDDPHGPFAVAHGISRHAALTTKLSQAYTRGAVAVLFVNDPSTGQSEHGELAAQVDKAKEQVLDLAAKIAAPDGKPEEHLPALRDALEHLKQVQHIHAEHKLDPLMEFGYGGTRTGKSIPCFQITQQVCNQILIDALGNDLPEIETQIDRTNKPLSRVLTGWTVAGEAAVETIKSPARNVIGVLPGTGPLSEETIVVGAHFDHLGYGEAGSLAPGSHEIHNGADDNASGTAGLLELARRLARRETPLPRRIVFIAFSGEERGLLGSEQYVENPLYPLKQTVAMLNMDMIGRMEDSKLVVFGTGTSARWDPLVDKLAEQFQLKISRKPEGFGPSDHSSFYARQVPVLHLFTGTHSDYHRPSDDWEKINAPDMVRVVDFLQDVIVDVAQAADRPDFINVAGTATLERTGNRPYFGSIPDFGSDAEGYAIQGVSPGSPAEKAGLKAKDVIIELGGQKIGGLDDFDLALRRFAPGQQVEVVVFRDGQNVTLKVTLASPRG